jgi:hypothetical protein
MNRYQHRFNWFGLSKKATVAMALFCIALFCVPAMIGQVAPSGSIIGNQATATYTDANSVSRTAFSNLVQTSVTQIYSGALTSSQTKYATPGTQVMFPHVYQNTGNGPDSITFSASGSANLSNVAVYLDANGDGIPDNTTNIAGAAQPLAANAYLRVVVVATLNAGAGSGGTVTVSTTDGHGVTPSNTDTVTLSNNGVINVTKSMSAPVAGVSTVTLTYTNTGNASVSALTINDNLASQGYFSYVTSTTKWNGTSLTDGTAPAGWNAFTIGSSPNYNLTFNIGTVAAPIAPGVTGTITFNVTVGTPSTYPANFTNFATYGYNDTASGTTDNITGINTNTVSLAFNGWDFAQFTAGAPGTFTASTVTGSNAAQNHTANGSNVIASTSVAQGATITWNETVTNNGVLTDVYNMTLSGSTFPAGTTFQLYRADGKTPLTDSNGDGIIDAGPLTASSATTVVVAATLPVGFTVTSATSYQVNLTATPTNATASNYGVAGIADINTLKVTVTTKNAGVDVTTSSTDAGGAAAGTGTGNAYTTAVSGNPGGTIAIPFYVFNNGANSASDAYNLSFAYSSSNPGNLSTPLTAFNGSPYTAGSVPPAIGTTIPAWTVQYAPATAANCSTYGSPVTATSVIAAAGNAEYCMLLQVPASYTAGTYYFIVQAQSNGTGALDQMAVTVNVNSYASVSVSPNNQGTVYAGGTVVYKHVITNGGNVAETANVVLNTPTLQATPAGWSAVIYNDAGSVVGQLDSGDQSVVGGSTIASLAPGASAIYYIVVQAPASANPGDTQVVTWAISFSSGTNNSTQTSVTDTTTVVSGQVKLLKQVSTADSACADYAAGSGSWSGVGGFTTANTTATSQQCLVYSIAATNVGAASVTNLTIADSAPPYTALSTGATKVVEVVPGTGCTGVSTSTITVNAPSFTALFGGSVPPQCTVNVYFEVKLN